MFDYTPNPIIVRKAVSLWRGLLLVPKYDNGARDIPNLMAQGLASSLPTNADDAGVMDRFCEELTKRLTGKYSFDRETREEVEDSEQGYFVTTLSVDYGPDTTLRAAARDAGLKMEFPWKTNMHLGSNHLSLCAGYSAARQNYYPLDDDGRQWLVTTLVGDVLDMEKVIDSVKNGNPLGLQVE